MTKTGKALAWVIVVIVVIVIAIIAVTRGGSETATEGGVIRIGVVAPLTGDAAPYGEPVRNAVMIAIEDINASGGINGRMLEAIYEDGKCDGKSASSATQKLLSIDKVKVIVGMPCSGEVLSSAPITEAAKAILLVQGSSPDITDAGEYIFRVFPSDALNGIELADKIKEHGYTKASVMTENTPYATAMEKTFSEAFTMGGGSVVAKENYNPDVKDFRSMLLKIKSANPQALFINSQTGASAARIAQQAREAGITAQFYAAFFSGPDFTKAGSFSEGAYIVDVPTVGSDNPAAADFVERYKARSGGDTNYIIFGGGAYDEVMVLAQAMREVGSDDADSLKDYFYSMPPYHGVIGDFNFDEKGDVVGIKLRWLQVKDGEAQIIKN